MHHYSIFLLSSQVLFFYLVFKVPQKVETSPKPHVDGPAPSDQDDSPDFPPLSFGNRGVPDVHIGDDCRGGDGGT